MKSIREITALMALAACCAIPFATHAQVDLIKQIKKDHAEKTGKKPAPQLNASVTDLWVKTTVPGGSVSAAYMKIKAPLALKLVKVETAIAGIVEIHDMKMNDGVMEMKAIDAIDVPANKVVELKPGGMHVMLLKVNKPIKTGDVVPLTLTFEDANKRAVSLSVEAIGKEKDSKARQH
jgi:periplasmic copper chaperone A